MTRETDEAEIAALRQQLQALDRDRERLTARLEELERARVEPLSAPSTTPPVTNSSPATDKIALFRRKRLMIDF